MGYIMYHGKYHHIFLFLLMQCSQSNNSHSVTRQISRCRSSGYWRRKILTGHGIQKWPDKQNTGAFQTSNQIQWRNAIGKRLDLNSSGKSNWYIKKCMKLNTFTIIYFYRDCLNLLSLNWNERIFFMINKTWILFALVSTVA